MTTQAQREHLDRVTRLIPGYNPWTTRAGYYFDYQRAQDCIDFYPECLTHTKGEWRGQPIVLESWQQGIIANLFGWKRADGTRRFRESLIYIPRKNAKSTLTAGIGLTLQFLDDEPGAEIYCAAGDEDQAAIVFESAKGMVLGCPELERRAQVFGSSILNFNEGSTLSVLTSKASTKHGLNPHGVIVDELHALKDRELVDVLTTAVGARRQPLIVYLTTADFDRPSICNETHDYACKVRDGIIDDPSFLPVIYEATLDEDWRSEATWAKANPNYGVSVKKDYIERACKKAQETPAKEDAFKRLHLNMKTGQASRWLSIEAWDHCNGDTPWQDLLESMRGRPCFAGLDLASTRDLAALGLIFPPELDENKKPIGPTIAVPIFWIPRESAEERERKDRVPYPLWAKQGALRMTEGNVIDYDVIRRDIGLVGEVVDIKEIAIDRWASAQISNQLAQDGFDVVAFGQGFASLSAPTKELEKLVIGKTFAHGGHPVLRWNASNVAIETDATAAIKPSKKKSTEKIDGIVATVMGIGGMLAQELTSGRSIYEDQGIFSV